MELNLTLRDKEKIKKYEVLFGLIARVFYNDLDIAVMDSIIHLFFKQFYFETQQVQQITNIPEKKLRKCLFNFERAKIIKIINENHIDFQKTYLRDIIEEKWNKDEQKFTEFWELNHDIRQTLHNRLVTIKKKIALDFRNFDQFSKICSNNFCRKQFKSEEYFYLNDKCSTCGSELKLRQQIEVEIQNKIEDRKQSLKIIQKLHDYLESIKEISFPDYLSLLQNSQNIFGKQNDDKEDDLSDDPNQSDIDAKEIDYLDYKLDQIRLEKQFFRNKQKIPMIKDKKFSQLLQVEKKSVLQFFREKDLQESFYEFIKLNKKEFLRKQRKKKIKKDFNLNYIEYNNLYNEFFKNLKYF